MSKLRRDGWEGTKNTSKLPETFSMAEGLAPHAKESGENRKDIVQGGNIAWVHQNLDIVQKPSGKN